MKRYLPLLAIIVPVLLWYFSHKKGATTVTPGNGSGAGGAGPQGPPNSPPQIGESTAPQQVKNVSAEIKTPWWQNLIKGLAGFLGNQQGARGGKPSKTIPGDTGDESGSSRSSSHSSAGAGDTPDDHVDPLIQQQLDQMDASRNGLNLGDEGAFGQPYSEGEFARAYNDFAGNGPSDFGGYNFGTVNTYQGYDFNPVTLEGYSLNPGGDFVPPDGGAYYDLFPNYV